ncbi:MAG: DsbA family protein [Pseudomonadales bacterium]
MLSVCIDFKSPYAFVAHALIWELETKHGFLIDWQPLTLNIGSFLGTAEKSEQGTVVATNRSEKQWTVVKAAYRDARRYAVNQQRMLRGPLKIWDSSLAGISLMWAQQRAGERADLKHYMDMVFTQFWQRKCDLEDAKVLVEYLKAAAISTVGFTDYLEGEGRENHDRLQSQLLDLGVFGVPSFLVEDEIFFGREHLDTVLWRLKGSHGEMPFLRFPWLPEQG